MLVIVNNLLFASNYIPHGHCYLWQFSLVWLHLLSDLLIAIAYYSISISLLYFISKREDVPFKSIFILFSVFIISCGTTHLMEIWTLWHPDYWISGTIKAITAIVSVYTAIELIPILPRAISLPSFQQLELALSDSVAINRALLNAIPDWMFRVNSRGIFLNYFSPPKDIPPPINAENIVNKQISQVLPEPISSQMSDLISVALNTNKLQVLEYELDKENCSYIYEARITVSAPHEVMVIIRDITEQKQHEKSIKQALDREKQLNELKSRFITLTSHEFRTPLATILSSCELLEHYASKWTVAKQNLHFHRIQTAVHHMTGLLNDVLLLGKAEAGKLKFKPETIELHSFARELVAEIQLTSQTHKIIFNSNCSGCQAQIDEKLMRQILTNLISNAIEYSPESDRVNLDLICQQDKFIFKVQDFGIGIPSEDKERLFDSFHRAINASNIPGTGLGLAIVKKAVELHNASISVESKLNIGSTFTISFPFQQNIIGG